MAGYLIEERRRWPVITASPRGQCSKYIIQNFEGKACSDEKTLPVTWSDEKLILLLYIAPVGDGGGIIIILEWTTSLDTSSRTLFVRMWGCPRHVERRVT